MSPALQKSWSMNKSKEDTIHKLKMKIEQMEIDTEKNLEKIMKKTYFAISTILKETNLTKSIQNEILRKLKNAQIESNSENRVSNDSNIFGRKKIHSFKYLLESLDDINYIFGQRSLKTESYISDKQLSVSESIKKLESQKSFCHQSVQSNESDNKSSRRTSAQLEILVQKLEKEIINLETKNKKLKHKFGSSQNLLNESSVEIKNKYLKKKQEMSDLKSYNLSLEKDLNSSYKELSTTTKKLEEMNKIIYEQKERIKVIKRRERNTAKSVQTTETKLQNKLSSYKEEIVELQKQINTISDNMSKYNDKKKRSSSVPRINSLAQDISKDISENKIQNEKTIQGMKRLSELSTKIKQYVKMSSIHFH